MRRLRKVLSLALAAAGLAGAQGVTALPSETPAKFAPVTTAFDHTRKEVMVPMRDGVKLMTVILIPKGARNAPILLTRTPYDAKALTSHNKSSRLASVLQGYDNATDVIVEGGYIRVVQDVRGKFGSEGDYVMNRPLRGPRNPTNVDHATDTYDTIEWLVKNTPESNGRVGILGISYDGFLPLMALVNPHPALKVSVPMNPMVDGWRGDDWFHNGAFRQTMLPYIYDQEATRGNDELFWRTHLDDYEMYLKAGSAGAMAASRGMQQLGFYQKLVEHPAYDAFWQGQAVDKVLAAQPLKVPVMLVHSLWDQEDIYGAPAVYRALKPKDTTGEMVRMVMGPWHHGQMIEDAAALGAIRWGSDTGTYFRREILAPFLAEHLKEGAPKSGLPAVVAFESGTNRWRSLPAWPGAVKAAKLYLRAGGRLSFEPPAQGEAAFEEYVSDPAKPVPFRARPVQPTGYGGDMTWPLWLADDQRHADGRTDVATFTSDVLTAPVKVTGTPLAHLVASTSGTDSDWVVKLIDVYPEEVASEPRMGGYQFMISADIFRGRYRESFETAKALEAGKPLAYRIELPTANHVFLPGHRIMVQVQSSWFPLYDRNPQTFVPNIFLAQPGDYKKATQRVYHAPGNATAIELPLGGR
ncbi:MAG: CocE/NonD family hydrolase [Bryobacterales bacterium]|nr:CocE/NonD family hydrolase [Bryobacterales bacterium]